IGAPSASVPLHITPRRPTATATCNPFRIFVAVVPSQSPGLRLRASGCRHRAVDPGFRLVAAEIACGSLSLSFREALLEMTRPGGKLPLRLTTETDDQITGYCESGGPSRVAAARRFRYPA